MTSTADGGAAGVGAKLVGVTDGRLEPMMPAVAPRAPTSGDWLSGLPSSDAMTTAKGNRFGTGRRRLVYPAVFLVYLLETVAGVDKHSHGIWAVVGYALVAVFAVTYLAAIPAVWSGNRRRFWILYSTLGALTAAELLFAHEDAFVMGIYVSIVGIAFGARWALPAAVALAAAAAFLPPAIGPWHAGWQPWTGLSILFVSLAMWAFFGIIRTNHALEEARAQVATLAAEGERNRIARDLHDLLGHSLTTITVKAGLAKRLAAQDPERAAIEIGEVEELARRSLSDVRAAVSNYRVVTLATELATAQEVLRASDIGARILQPTDVVDADLQELFGWVVREGITNVVRHAHASTCTISLGTRSIEIVDDGTGSIGGTGSGLAGLRERVDAAGGAVETGTVRGGGWRVAVVVP